MSIVSTRTVEVPVITRRKRIPQAAIDHVIQQIIEKFRPLQIILFGSYAYGAPRPESDVDLLVVMGTALKESEQEIRICQSIEYHFGLDLIVRTPETITRRLELGDPFTKEIIREGKVVYECPAS